jgi:hypothetical protein
MRTRPASPNLWSASAGCANGDCPCNERRQRSLGPMLVEDPSNCRRIEDNGARSSKAGRSRAVRARDVVLAAATTVSAADRHATAPGNAEGQAAETLKRILEALGGLAAGESLARTHISASRRGLTGVPCSGYTAPYSPAIMGVAALAARQDLLREVEVDVVWLEEPA